MDSAQAASAATAPVIESEAPASLDPISAEDAAVLLGNLRNQPPEQEADESAAKPAAPAKESASQEDDSDPQDAAHAEQTEEDEPAEKQPPIDPPRFWTSEAKERFNSLPRETQQYIVEREQARDAEVRRTQNETAEQRKAFEAKSAEVDKVRQEYEAKLPALNQLVQSELSRQFPDIKSQADIDRYANEALAVSSTDPFRSQQITAYLTAFRAAYDRTLLVANELQQSEQRKAQESQKQTAERKTREHSLLMEKAPEFSDPKKLDAAQKAVVQALRNEGFTDDELPTIASNALMDDHRMQLMLWKAARFDELQKVKVEAVKKPLPPVQKPGAAAPRGAAGAESVQTLSRRLDQTGNPDDAFALWMAQRKAS